MLATLGQLTEFRVTFGGSRGTVMLMYGDKRRKRTRGKKSCAPGAVKGGGNQNRQLNCRRRSHLLCRNQPSQELPEKSRGGGPKSVAKPSGAVPSDNWNPSSPTRTIGKGSRQKSPPRPSATGTSTLLPTAPVEPPVTAVVPVEQVAQKRKASSPLLPRNVTRPTSPPTPPPTCWVQVRTRLKGRFEDFISPPVENITDLPRKLGISSHKWTTSASG